MQLCVELGFRHLSGLGSNTEQNSRPLIKMTQGPCLFLSNVLAYKLPRYENGNSSPCSGLGIINLTVWSLPNKVQSRWSATKLPPLARHKDRLLKMSHQEKKRDFIQFAQYVFNRADELLKLCRITCT